MKTGTNCISGRGEKEGVLENAGENGVEIAPDLDVLGSWKGCFGQVAI